MASAIDVSSYAAVVTGGARGIGYACAERLLQSGATVALWDVDEAALGAGAEGLSGSGAIYVQVADVSHAASVDNASRETLRMMGKVDILINNAGITGPNKTTWEYPPDEWRKVIEIDLVGPYLCSRALIPGMIARGYGPHRPTAPLKPASRPN